MATYTIIGHDQKPYGPVTDDQIRQWIAAGRVNPSTRVQLEGTSDWKTLSEFPEFAGALSGTISPAGPLKTSRMAITSLVLGIVCFATCFTTFLIVVPLGLGFGIAALVAISKNREELRGRGLAIAGVIVNGVALLALPVAAAMLLPAFAAAKQKSQEIVCINNEKQLALGIKIYADNHTNCFPTATSWCDAIQPYVNRNPRLFKCPTASAASRCDYAFNEKLGGLNEEKVNPETVMIFEADAGWNASGGSESLVQRPRHARETQVIVGFADGSVRAVPRSQLGTLRWDP